MAKLKFDQPGEHFYENGVDHGVLFVANENGNGFEAGVAWNGLTNVTLSPEGGEPNDIYADNIKYLSLMSVETLKATIEAYQSPTEFDVCDGTEEIAGMSGITMAQQTRRKFAFVFRTKKGSDSASGNGYKLHILYGCLASPSEKAYETINDSPDATTLSWDVSTTPDVIETDDGETKYTSLITVDSDCDAYVSIENKLYGTTSSESEYMSAQAIYDLVSGME